MSDNPFDLALERIREHGWGHFDDTFVFDGSAICIEQALGKWGAGQRFGWCRSASGGPLDRLLAEVLDEQYPERIHLGVGHVVPFGWNDDPERTQDDVERVLEKCAVRWNEEAA